MVNIIRLNGRVHLFVMHEICEPKIIEMFEYFSHDGDAVEGGGNDDNMVGILNEKDNGDEIELVKKGLSQCKVELEKGFEFLPCFYIKIIEIIILFI